MEYYSFPGEPLLELLPETLRDGYLAAELTLRLADKVVNTVKANLADDLPQALGRLRSYLRLNKCAIYAGEPDIAASKKIPFRTALGETYTTAHLAALDFGFMIVDTVGAVAHPGMHYDVGAFGKEGVRPWSMEAKWALVKYGVLSKEGGPGPKWGTFRQAFIKALPRDRPQDLITQMRQELAEWLDKTPRPRLVIDLESNFLTLDGVRHTNLDPTSLRIISALYDAQRSEAPCVSSTHLSESVPGCRGGEKAVRRCLERLPEPVRALVKGVRGKGRWLELPPPK